MANLGYQGVQSTATFEMTQALKDLVKADTNDVKGRGFGVQISAAKTVDVGTAAGKPLFGVILQTDSRGLATVQFKDGAEDVMIHKIGTTPKFPDFGVVGLGVDATCGIVALAAGRQVAVVDLGTTTEDVSRGTIIL